MIKDLLTLIGAVTVIIMIGFVIIIIIDAIKELIRKLKIRYKQKHRFDKPPTAKCYCVDCIYHDNKTERCCHLKAGTQQILGSVGMQYPEKRRITMPDFIDRKRLLKYIDNMRIEDCISNPVIETANTMQSLFKQVVEAMPKANIERHAHWIKQNNLIVKCSNCNYLEIVDKTGRFCKHCGCSMDKVVQRD